MSMEAAALIGMGIIAVVAIAAAGLALWATHHEQVRHKNALPSH